MAFEDDFLVDLEPRRWTSPDGTPKALATGGLFLGGGDHPLEVALATSPQRPKAEDVRKLWHGRQGKRPSPLVLIIGYPDHGATRLTVCGPVGEQPPLLNDLELSQVERLAAAALAEPNRHAAIRFLVAMLPEVGADLPGLRNSGLLASQELRSGVPQRLIGPQPAATAHPSCRCAGDSGRPGTNAWPTVSRSRPAACDGCPDVALEMIDSPTFDGSIQLVEYRPRVLEHPPLGTAAS